MSDSIKVERINETQNANSILLGGNPNNPTWEEYLDQYVDDFRPNMLALKEHIETSGLLGMTGEEMQNQGEGAYRFSDGREIAFTWRAWGDLMQAIVNKREGYMAYYM